MKRNASHRRHTGAVLLIAVSLLLATGTAFFATMEGWSLLEAFYFSVITLSTVGYGDFAPTTDASRMFVVGYVLFGVGLLAVAMRQVFARYVQVAATRFQVDTPFIAFGGWSMRRWENEWILEEVLAAEGWPAIVTVSGEPFSKGGITCAMLATYRDVSAAPQDLRELDFNEAKNIHRRFHLVEPDFAVVDDAVVRLQMVDASATIGAEHAIRWLRRALQCTEEGASMDAAVAERLLDAPMRVLSMALCASRLRFVIGEVNRMHEYGGEDCADANRMLNRHMKSLLRFIELEALHAKRRAATAGNERVEP